MLAQLLWASKHQQELALEQVSLKFLLTPMSLINTLFFGQRVNNNAFEYSLLHRIRKSKKSKPLSRKERCSQPRRKRKKKF